MVNLCQLTKRVLFDADRVPFERQFTACSRASDGLNQITRGRDRPVQTVAPRAGLGPSFAATGLLQL